MADNIQDDDKKTDPNNSDESKKVDPSSSADEGATAPDPTNTTDGNGETPTGNSSENPTGSEGDDEGDGEDDDTPEPTDYFKINEVDALNATDAYLKANDFQEAKLIDVEDNSSDDNQILGVVNRITESYEINQLNKIKSTKAPLNVQKLAIKAIARKKGYVLDFEMYKDNYDLLIDRLIEKLGG